MKNEIIDFFQKNKNDLEFIIEDSKNLLSSHKINDARSLTLVSVFYQFLSEEKIEFFLKEIFKASNSNSSDQERDEFCLNILSNFIKEEQYNIIDYVSLNKFLKSEEYPKLINIEWKFVGLSTADKFEVGEMVPKILLKLVFNNGRERIIETDYAGLKKLHEELEENLNSLNSAYARRIQTFAK